MSCHYLVLKKTVTKIRLAGPLNTLSNVVGEFTTTSPSGFFLGDRKNNKFSSQKRNGSIHRNAGDFTSQKILENLHHETWGGMKPEASTRHVRGQKKLPKIFTMFFFLGVPITKKFQVPKMEVRKYLIFGYFGGWGFP